VAASTNQTVSRWLAGGSVALTIALLTVAQVVAHLAGNAFVLGDLFIGAIGLVFSVVGVLVATRHPDNAIGWIFVLVGVAAGVAQLAGAYADYWLHGVGGSRSIAEAAAVYETLSWIPFILVPATFLLLLFPDGRLLSGRWRRIAWCAALGITGVFVTGALTSGPLEDYPEIQNPFGVDTTLLDPLTGLSFLLTLVGVVGSSASLIVRYRRARGEQRQQIKWLAFAGGLVAVTIPIAVAAYDAAETASNVAIMLSVLTLPVAAGIAILRYRLYDIDVVINRTLVYGALTAMLAALYVATVLVLQLALGGLTQDSGIAVAGSTLAVAAAFRPARRRVQEFVDRRFYRRRYDATRTLEEFSSRLRDQVDLAALDGELRSVVAETMQPAHVSLWLREAV
jgi:hypothetical protein